MLDVVAGIRRVFGSRFRLNDRRDFDRRDFDRRDFDRRRRGGFLLRRRFQFQPGQTLDQDGDEIPDGMALEPVPGRPDHARDLLGGVGVGEDLGEAMGHPADRLFFADGVATQRFSPRRDISQTGRAGHSRPRRADLTGISGDSIT
ncbi:hypothetical protein [Microtetraspora sp. NBRC 13810]|uniref:hypothetical protein n=1 Tax=Microtetraspora sp. NBRC 13810 TaxID=3030990 RepID=UPI0025531931|nr:hypothetical protein [Microtetraspora sp. NBRC 13810]